VVIAEVIFTRVPATGARFATVIAVAAFVNAVPVITGVIVLVSAAVGVTEPASEMLKLTAVPTTPVADAVAVPVPVRVVDPDVSVAVYVPAACAGTTDKSPNPSEATATADTFFNEIVFTIFLSFSRSQAFPGLGWWLKRPPH
jgi:hypothetical protein